jgi:hypothetical protein
MLPRARQIREPQIDHLHVPVLDGLQHVIGFGAVEEHGIPSRHVTERQKADREWSKAVSLLAICHSRLLSPGAARASA